ncbi:MAG: Eisosome component PIL1/LSP1 family protein [Lachnospiraceae bacterium]|nr:Eisosome component PIL1/LSP1 family protein [Lachnospiraceae bacterium]
MTAKEYLKQIRALNRQIDNMIEDLSMTRELATKTSVGEQNPDKVQTSGINDKVSKLVSYMVDQERAINEKIDEYIDLKAKIIKEINRLEKKVHRDILFERYILFKPYQKIAKDLSYSEKYILNQHGEALIEFQRRYGTM